MSELRLKVVFDCNVLLQAATRANGPAAECLRLVESGTILLCLSKPILREVRATLADSGVRSRNPNLTDASVNAFLQRIAFRGNLLRDVPHAFDLPRDRDDEKYIDVAAASDANILLTRDRDFLDLRSDHDIVGKQFRQRFPQLRILDPVEFLNEIRRSAQGRPNP